MLPDLRTGIPAAMFLALAGCNAPPEAEFPMTAAAAARPAPDLVATETFTKTLDASVPAAERLGEQRDTLAASADGLRTRAAGLSSPVLDPEERARLIAASEGAAAN